jgi:hypothetical protein
MDPARFASNFDFRQETGLLACIRLPRWRLLAARALMSFARLRLSKNEAYDYS